MFLNLMLLLFSYLQLLTSTSDFCKDVGRGTIQVIKPNQKSIEIDALYNIQLQYIDYLPKVSNLSLTYGTCDEDSSHQVIGSFSTLVNQPTKFVWNTPNTTQLIGSTNQCIKVVPIGSKCSLANSLPFQFVASSFDRLDEDSSWRYDAVVDFQTHPKLIVDDQPKSVGIVGGGMSGMFSYLLLNSLKLNYSLELIESNQRRVGGRIYTYHFPDGDRYDYHELGAMRLIKNWTFPNRTQVEDRSSRSVFKLIDYLNLNAQQSQDRLKLIPFIFGKTQDSHFGTFSGWQQVEDGLDRFPKLLRSQLIQTHLNLTFGKVFALNYTNHQVEISYKPKLQVNTKTRTTVHDYVMVATPLTQVRFWKLPKFTKDLYDLIHFQHHDRSCKVLLKFEHRFWNATEFVGQQLSNNQTTLFTTVYPSHGNSKVLIASYVYTDRLETQESASIPEMEMLAIDELVQVHGEVVRKAYRPGNIKSKCWHLDPNAKSGFVYFNYLHEKVQQLPPFNKMQNNIVFTVDSTDHRASWVGGALNAALRGTLQVLIKDGHVDEARDLKLKWGGDYHHV